MGSAHVTAPKRGSPEASSSNKTRLCPDDFHKAVTAKCAKIHAKRKSIKRQQSLPIKIK